MSEQPHAPRDPLPEPTLGGESSQPQDDQTVREAGEHTHEARLRVLSTFHGEEHVHGSGFLNVTVSGFSHGVIACAVVAAGIQAFGFLYDTAGSLQLSGLMLALGVAFALADGVAVGSAQAMKLSFYEREMARERREIKEQPEFERAEMIALYKAKGLNEPLLGQVVDAICADPDKLLKLMMEEELGLIMEEEFDHPISIGLFQGFSTLAGFVVVTLALYLAAGPHALYWALAAGALSLMAVGGGAAVHRKQSALRYGAALVVAMSVAAATAFFMAQFMRSLIEK